MGLLLAWGSAVLQVISEFIAWGDVCCAFYAWLAARVLAALSNSAVLLLVCARIQVLSS